MAQLAIGIVGLPNVGKSSLFQALTATAVPAENYPFCTIDPNVGVVEVPEPRLPLLAAIVKPRATVHAVVEFVDIAGLVEGASRGEGLGNQFLQHIREVDAIAHVVRCFEDASVARVGPADPVREVEIVDTELALADLAAVESRLDKTERMARSGDGDAAVEMELLRRVKESLERGAPARALELDEEERRTLRPLNLLTAKPTLYVANVDEEELPDGGECATRLRAALETWGRPEEVVPVCARLDAELNDLEPAERDEYLAAVGLNGTGLDRLIRAGYRALGLHTFFTFNEKEARAWMLAVGATAPQAAGRVHTDFEHGFIRAEAIGIDEFLDLGSMKEAREHGRVRSEGREYVVRDGDVLLFRTSA